MNYHKEKKSNRRLIWISFILSFFLLFFAIKISLSELPDRSSIIEIKGILKDVKIEKGRRNRALVIHLNEYPEINFVIGSVVLNQTSFHDLMSDNKPGDSIMFFIENQEYNRKILKSEKIPFPGNLLYKNNIDIVEIHNRNTEYLSFNGYIKATRNNNYLIIAFLGFFGLLMLLVGIKGVKYYKANFSK
ncbi:hypothetical protein [Chryseobacterium phocaeense]|uniref:hypothetical protein n=1 Tax=Chryseobacterium phocaeense TaxID=1816690 RepID=UPI0009BB2858|nr:hypothetical protein [Chryseobacterium phocaeense]